jgi:hypothetical protein
MRRIIATTGATLVAMAAVAASATPASAGCVTYDGIRSCSDSTERPSPGSLASTSQGGEVLSVD